MQFPDYGSNSDVILVDEQDQALGTQEKLRAHLGGGQLHRAFSIFIIDDRGRVLLQRRAANKYHCPGLWANSCCSHPQPGRSILRCARQRLQEELGFTAPLQKIGAVLYCLPLKGGLTEWEFDHIYLGHYNGPVVPNPRELAEYQWVSLDKFEQDFRHQTDRYTPWLPQIAPLFLEHLRGRRKEAFQEEIATNG